MKAPKTIITLVSASVAKNLFRAFLFLVMCVFLNTPITTNTNETGFPALAAQECLPLNTLRLFCIPRIFFLWFIFDFPLALCYHKRRLWSRVEIDYLPDSSSSHLRRNIPSGSYQKYHRGGQSRHNAGRSARRSHDYSYSWNHLSSRHQK